MNYRKAILAMSNSNVTNSWNELLEIKLRNVELKYLRVWEMNFSISFLAIPSSGIPKTGSSYCRTSISEVSSAGA